MRLLEKEIPLVRMRTWLTALAAGGSAVGATTALATAPGAQLASASVSAPASVTTTGPRTAEVQATVQEAARLQTVVSGLEAKMKVEEQQVAAGAAANSAEQGQLASERATLASEAAQIQAGAAQLQAEQRQVVAEEQQLAAARQQTAAAAQPTGAPTYHSTTGASGASHSDDGGDD